MDMVLSNLEKYAAVLLIAGVVLALIAFLWLVVAAFRGARTRGPLVLFFVAGLIAAAPTLAAVLDGQPYDLGPARELLDGGVRLQLTTADGREGPPVAVRVRALFHIVGGILGGLAFFWLLLLGLSQWSKVRRPVYLFLFAGLLIASPFLANRLAQRLVDFGPRERVVNGESHLTLTGWDRDDYSVLRARPEVVVLQMANEDVTDDTLRNLEGMTRLRELDLSNSRITDAGLAVLRSLPSLESLRLARTAVTDEGFQEHVAPLESLKRLDLTGTQVSGEVISEWKQARPGRRAVR
jgi:hypothetical protein